MTTTQSTPNPAPPAPPAERRGNGFGLTALIIGIVALLIGLIPFAGYGSWVLSVLAVVFGIIAVTRRGRPKVLGFIGLALGVVSLIVGLAISISATASVVNSVNDSLNKTVKHTITYTVTGNGKNADITYSELQGDTSKSVQHSQSLPFTRTISVTEKGTLNVNAFTVTANYPISTSTGKQLGSKLACSVKVDGVSKGTDTSSGDGAVVSCSGSAG